MKIAISARGPTADCAIDERLGRAYWILIYHFEEDAWSIIDNSANRNATQGAGKRTAQALIELGVTHVLTGEIGPKAFRLLNTVGIEIFLGAAGTAAGALLAWQRGDLHKAKAANETGSPSCLMNVARPLNRTSIVETILPSLYEGR